MKNPQCVRCSTRKSWEGQETCTCISAKPGISHLPRAFTTVAPEGIANSPTCPTAGSRSPAPGATLRPIATPLRTSIRFAPTIATTSAEAAPRPFQQTPFTLLATEQAQVLAVMYGQLRQGA